MRCNAIAGGSTLAVAAYADASEIRRCRHEGVVRYPTGKVCRNHHNHGFVPYEQTIAAMTTPSSAMAERMRAVVEEEAAA